MICNMRETSPREVWNVAKTKISSSVSAPSYHANGGASALKNHQNAKAASPNFKKMQISAQHQRKNRNSPQKQWKTLAACPSECLVS